MNETLQQENQQQQDPQINGVALSELPSNLQYMFDRVMKLQKAYQEANATALQKKSALEELSTMLAEEIEQYKTGKSELSESDEVEATDPTTEG